MFKHTEYFRSIFYVIFDMFFYFYIVFIILYIFIFLDIDLYNIKNNVK